MRIPKHMSGLLISLWEPANLLFVRHKSVTLTENPASCRLRTKAEARQTYHLTPQLAVNETCVWFIGDLLHTYDNYFEFTFNRDFLWSKIYLY